MNQQEDGCLKHASVLMGQPVEGNEALVTPRKHVRICMCIYVYRHRLYYVLQEGAWGRARQTKAMFRLFFLFYFTFAINICISFVVFCKT